MASSIFSLSRTPPNHHLGWIWMPPRPHPFIHPSIITSPPPPRPPTTTNQPNRLRGRPPGRQRRADWRRPPRHLRPHGAAARIHQALHLLAPGADPRCWCVEVGVGGFIGPCLLVVGGLIWVCFCCGLLWPCPAPPRWMLLVGGRGGLVDMGSWVGFSVGLDWRRDRLIDWL